MKLRVSHLASGLLVGGMLGSTAAADYTFAIPDFSVTSESPFIHNQTVPAGNYNAVQFNADWTAGSGGPWSSELNLTITSPDGPFGPWFPGGANSGDPFTFNSQSPLPGVWGGGAWSFSFDTSFLGSTANLADIEITLLELLVSSFSGFVDGTNGPFFDRPNQGIPPTGTLTGNYAYDFIPFQVDETGNYIIESFYDFDGFVVLYEGGFDPDNPLDFAISSDDDHPDLGTGGSLLTGIELIAGQTYYLVQTAFAQNNGGNWDTNIIGPGTATIIPAPAALALLSIAGFIAITRRRRSH